MRGRALPLLVTGLLLVGCGGGREDDGILASGREPPREPPAPAYTRPNRPSPPPPTSPAVSPAAYARALQRYCTTTTRALDRFLATGEAKDDPLRPLEVLATRYRAGLERLGRLTPPDVYRPEHLLALAGGRETADRLDDGVRLGREGDIGAATDSLAELSGALPTLSPELLRAAPACAPTPP